MNRLLLLCITAFALSAPAFSWASFSDRYDRQIQKATERWLPAVPWQLYKAQLWQESRLQPDAISPAGAAGLAQFMPGTWVDVSRQLGWVNVNPYMAGPAIEAGAYYMASLRRQWSSPRPEWDRHSLALASYNAGLGNLLHAQRLCHGQLLYPQIAACLPHVTGSHAQETLNYVPSIWRFYQQLAFRS